VLVTKTKVVRTLRPTTVEEIKQMHIAQKLEALKVLSMETARSTFSISYTKREGKWRIGLGNIYGIHFIGTDLEEVLQQTIDYITSKRTPTSSKEVYTL